MQEFPIPEYAAWNFVKYSNFMANTAVVFFRLNGLVYLGARISISRNVIFYHEDGSDNVSRNKVKRTLYLICSLRTKICINFLSRKPKDKSSKWLIE
jgi:hypothetical protein